MLRAVSDFQQLSHNQISETDQTRAVYGDRSDNYDKKYTLLM